MLPLAAAVLVTACSSTQHSTPRPKAAAPAMRLVAYDTCQALLDGLRAATAKTVGPYGLPSTGGVLADGSMALRQSVPGAESSAAAPQYSGTNVQESGVDEPDMVKTDGRRIVVAAQGRIWVIDAATRKITGSLTIPRTASGIAFRAIQSGNLLLSGDRLLIISPQPIFEPLMRERPPITPQSSGATTPYRGPQTVITMVDLTAAPKVTGTLTVHGDYVDARQVGSVARIVVRSTPQIRFPQPPRESSTGDTDKMTEANRQVVQKAPLSAWLPSYEISTPGSPARSTQVPCDQVSHPANASASSLLSVMTVDLAKGLGDPQPISVTADGSKVYGTGSSLYVAGVGWTGGPTYLPDLSSRTDLHKFDISGSGRPRYVASGDVPGVLLNQYAMSEYDGNLRLATTTSAQQTQTSTVYVLAPHGSRLDRIGSVGGLGKGEQIRAVRFLGPTGYVVTFRQTDPLYTVNLADPRHPAVTGELKLQGYSAYLHPTAQGRLLGVGQDATASGRVTGAQVQLFDVSSSAPKRVGGVELPGAYTQVEYDPHAFLYWPQSGLTVVPMTGMTSQVLVLSVGPDGIKRLGTIQQPKVNGYADQIQRSVLVGDSLWTISNSGAQASAAGTLASQSWVPFKG